MTYSELIKRIGMIQKMMNEAVITMKNSKLYLSAKREADAYVITTQVLTANRERRRKKGKKKWSKRY